MLILFFVMPVCITAFPKQLKEFKQVILESIWVWFFAHGYFPLGSASESATRFGLKGFATA